MEYNRLRKKSVNFLITYSPLSCSSVIRKWSLKKMFDFIWKLKKIKTTLNNWHFFSYTLFSHSNYLLFISFSPQIIFSLFLHLNLAPVCSLFAPWIIFVIFMKFCYVWKLMSSLYLYFLLPFFPLLTSFYFFERTVCKTNKK